MSSKVLGEDIKKHGLLMRIAVWQPYNCGPWYLVDGRNRLDAAELVGLSVQIIKERNVTVKIAGMCLLAHVLMPWDDPYAFALSANIHRRHLTIEQKRDLIAKVLKAQPEKSNRTIAKQTKVDDKTVGSRAWRLEARAEIPHHDVTRMLSGRSNRPQGSRQETPRHRG